MAEVSVPRDLFRKILSLIDDLRRRPVPVEAVEIKGPVQTTREVCLDGGQSDRMAFQSRADLQNLAIGWLQRGYSSVGGGTVVQFPLSWVSFGKCRLGAFIGRGGLSQQRPADAGCSAITGYAGE